MKCWVLWWLLLCFMSTIFILSDATAKTTSSSVSPKSASTNADQGCSKKEKSSSTSYPTTRGTTSCSDAECENNNGASKAMCCINFYSKKLHGSRDDILESATYLQEALEDTDINETTSISFNNIVAAVYKPTNVFSGLEFNANDSETKINKDVSNRKVKVSLPRELDVAENNTVVFTVIQLSNMTDFNISDELYEDRLIGVSVSGKNISGLQERVNITINITTNINKTQEPQCVFLITSNGSTAFDHYGCETMWDHDLNEIICSCNHLTFFGVLLVSVSEGSLSPVDQKVLSYITIIGCCISLFALVLTVLIFITNRKFREDDSKKIHISLSVALILLNLHFLPSEAVAASSLHGFCFYMALGLHYSLLATFTWMALEGLHLYLLLVKVFNIYVKRYLLKLSLVGWGVPAVIVSAVVIVDTNYYGHAPVDRSNLNGSAICYLTDDTVKLGSTVGVFSLVFLFNVIMFGITIKWFVKAKSSKEIGHSARNSAGKEICTLLSVMVLLGITWGLIFFSFGPLTTPGLYAFCILNSLQGLVIFIYFILSLKKPKGAAAKQSSETISSRT